MDWAIIVTVVVTTGGATATILSRLHRIEVRLGRIERQIQGLCSACSELWRGFLTGAVRDREMMRALTIVNPQVVAPDRE